jgi:hypothetical protein
MCKPNLIWYCELWVNLRSLRLDFKKNLTKDENFVHEEYIWTKLIFVTQYEKWEIYFASEIVNDVFSSNFRWRMKMI